MGCTKPEKETGIQKQTILGGASKRFEEKIGPQKCMIRLHLHNFSFPQKLYVEKPYVQKEIHLQMVDVLLSCFLLGGYLFCT